MREGEGEGERKGERERERERERKGTLSNVGDASKDFTVSY